MAQEDTVMNEAEYELIEGDSMQPQSNEVNEINDNAESDQMNRHPQESDIRDPSLNTAASALKESTRADRTSRTTHRNVVVSPSKARSQSDGNRQSQRKEPAKASKEHEELKTTYELLREAHASLNRKHEELMRANDKLESQTREPQAWNRDNIEQNANDFDHLRDEVQRLEQAYEDMRSERDALQVDMALQRENHRTTSYKKLQETTQAHKAVEQKLNEEIAQYKMMISASTHIENQESDESIQLRFNDIFCHIRDIVVPSFRGVEFNYEGLSNDAKQWLRIYVPSARQLPKECWLYMVISIVSKHILNISRPRYYCGDSRSEPVSLVMKLTDFFAFDRSPEGKQWLEETRKLLAARYGGRLQEAEDTLIAHEINELRESLRNAMPRALNTKFEKALGDIFRSMLEFSRLLYRQRANFQIEMLVAVNDYRRTQFDPTTMEDINQAGDEATGQEVEVSIFPYICKRGDERGVHMDVERVVAQPKVMLRRPRSDSRETPVVPARSRGQSAELNRGRRGTSRGGFLRS